MNNKGNDNEIENCNYKSIIERYGPDYEGLKVKLGWTRGLFDK